jgi:outer membrane immunogenic protein
MRVGLLAATALSTAGIWPAFAFGQAATLPLPKHDWSGFYLGAAVGGRFGHNAAKLDLPDSTSYDVTFSGNTPQIDGNAASSIPWPTSYNLDSGAGLGSLIAGYNLELGRVVLGIEADWSYLGENSRDSWSSGSGNQVEVYGGVDHLFTVRPRVGIPVTDKLLLFGTGGLAIGDLSIGSASSIDATYSDAGKTRVDTVNWSGNDSTWKLGYTVGGGAEYALSPRASTTFEALYYNLGSASAAITGSGNESIDYTDPNETDTSSELTVEPYKAKLKADGVIARVGFNFKF